MSLDQMNNYLRKVGDKATLRDERQKLADKINKLKNSAYTSETAMYIKQAIDEHNVHVASLGIKALDVIAEYENNILYLRNFEKDPIEKPKYIGTLFGMEVFTDDQVASSNLKIMSVTVPIVENTNALNAASWKMVDELQKHGTILPPAHFNHMKASLKEAIQLWLVEMEKEKK